MTHWRADRPHNELPLLPPEAELETRPVLKACIEARAAVAALDRSAQLIPNPRMLVNTLPVLEAQASSEIENIVTTADVMFQHLRDDSGADAATKEALRYREALIEGPLELSTRPLSTRTAETICSRIKGVDMSVRRVPGTKIANTATGEVIYTPPDSESRIRELLANWERFVHDDGAPDPLVRLAVAHYQFEAIHPFTDGNGRTGRVMNSLMLVQFGLLRLPILYLSRFIIRHRSDYYRLLLSVTTERAWEPWVLYVVRGIEETARWTTAKIDAVRSLEEATTTFVRRDLSKLYSHELVRVLLEQPYCRIANIVDAGIAKRETAATYLRRLAGAGVLREISSGREKLFVNDRLLHVLKSEASDFPRFSD